MGDAERAVESLVNDPARARPLGVTNVTVLPGEWKVAVPLEGWAFDVDRSAEEAARAVGVARERVSVLRPVLESAIHRLRKSDVGLVLGLRADQGTQALVLLAAGRAAMQVRAQTGKSGVGIVSGDLEIDKAIELFEALVAADLCLGRAEQPFEHALEVGRLHH
jgi:hypothetical protein